MQQKVERKRSMSPQSPRLADAPKLVTREERLAARKLKRRLRKIKLKSPRKIKNFEEDEVRSKSNHLK
jgi:hypothetical protein